jgi:serine protease inhibitor
MNNHKELSCNTIQSKVMIKKCIRFVNRLRAVGEYAVFFYFAKICYNPHMVKTLATLRKVSVATAFFVIAALLLPACASSQSPEPAPTATSPVEPSASSFADGRGLALGFKLLYALDMNGTNGVLGTTGLAEVLAVSKDGAAGNTDAALAGALGMQGMLPRQINEVALRMRQTLGKLAKGKITQAWGLFIPENLYIKEAYNSDCRLAFETQPRFLESPLTSGNINTYLGEWADDSTGGHLKDVHFTLPDAAAPFFVDILMADPEWQTALSAGKSRPFPFLYEDGSNKAVPTMICLQNCGLYECPQGSIAILPTAGDETRLVILQPPDGMTLHEFIPVAAANHDDWVSKVNWGIQRVLLPRFSLSFEGSALEVLGNAGIAALLAKGADFSSMGNGMYVADILHRASLVVDESGVDEPDPNAPTYRQNSKDGIRTLAVDRPFIVALEKTDENGGCGQVLMMGVVYDPLS